MTYLLQMKANTFKNKPAVISFVAIILAMLAATSLWAQKPANITGSWKMSVETSVGSGSPTFELKHVNDSIITGTYKGQLGEAPVKGKLKHQLIHLEFSVSGTLVEYDGTVSDSAMKGKVKLGSMGSGTFTGTRAKL